MKYCFHMIALMLVLLGFAACSGDKMSNDVVVQNTDFTVTADSVIQGDWVASAISPLQIVSNYNPTDSADARDGIIRFRLAFNGHDNEMHPGEFHFALRGVDTTSIVACVPDSFPKGKGDLKAKKWTLRVDLSRQLKELKDRGFFVTPEGDTIYKEEFKGVWVAGNLAPLSWHYYDLEEQSDLRLHETADEGIYELSLSLSSPEISLNLRHEWKIDQENLDYPTIKTKMPLIDALYNMSIDDIAHSIESDDGGAKFKKPGNHTRLSYPILLALSYLNPKESMASLRSSVENGVIRHSHNHSVWPICVDDISWATAAWEVYAVTGDKKWLEFAYSVIKKTVDQDYAVNGDINTGLVHGGVYFAFSQSQSYPKWMEYKDIYETTSLASNALYERTFEILNDMSDELDIMSDYGAKAQQIKDALNESLWDENDGYYHQYTYMNAAPICSPGIDNFGQSLCVLWNIADDNRAENLIAKTPISNFGVPTSCPRYPTDEDANLSEIVSPILQAFWNLAAAKTENESMLRRGLGALYRAQAMTCANRASYNAYTGVPMSTEDGDIGGASANAAMIYRVYAGMTFLSGGIEFNPFVPVFLDGGLQIKNFKYRNSTLDITIDGVGNDIESFSIDGVKTNDNFVSQDLEGHHMVEIKMVNNNKATQTVTMAAKDYIIPRSPIVQWGERTASLLRFDARDSYRLMVDGKVRYQVHDTTFIWNNDSVNFSVNTVVSIGKYAFSYVAEPHYMIRKCATLRFADFAKAGTHLVNSGRASSVVESSSSANGTIALKYNAAVSGDYLLDLRYANGISSSYCPAYIVSVNGHVQGTIVTPFRGASEWLNMGMSNIIKVELLKGDNSIEVKRVDMYESNNPVLLSTMRIIKK